MHYVLCLDNEFKIGLCYFVGLTRHLYVDLGVACFMLILNEATASEKGAYQPIRPRGSFYDKIVLSDVFGGWIV